MLNISILYIIVPITAATIARIVNKYITPDVVSKASVIKTLNINLQL